MSLKGQHFHQSEPFPDCVEHQPSRREAQISQERQWLGGASNINEPSQLQWPLVWLLIKSPNFRHVEAGDAGVSRERVCLGSPDVPADFFDMAPDSITLRAVVI
jgi:hypothetical protein